MRSSGCQSRPHASRRSYGPGLGRDRLAPITAKKRSRPRKIAVGCPGAWPFKGRSWTSSEKSCEVFQTAVARKTDLFIVVAIQRCGPGWIGSRSSDPTFCPAGPASVMNIVVQSLGEVEIVTDLSCTPRPDRTPRSPSTARWPTSNPRISREYWENVEGVWRGALTFRHIPFSRLQPFRNTLRSKCS